MFVNMSMVINNQGEKKNSTIVVVITLILGVLAIWGIYALVNSINKGEKVESSIFSYHVVDQSTLSVEYRVTNTSKITGKSSCNITMNDSTSTYAGYDSGYESAKEIKPGETYSGIAKVTISKEGAQYVTKGSIGCRIQ